MNEYCDEKDPIEIKIGIVVALGPLLDVGVVEHEQLNLLYLVFKDSVMFYIIKKTKNGSGVNVKYQYQIEYIDKIQTSSLIFIGLRKYEFQEVKIWKDNILVGIIKNNDPEIEEKKKVSYIILLKLEYQGITAELIGFIKIEQVENFILYMIEKTNSLIFIHVETSKFYIYHIHELENKNFFKSSPNELVPMTEADFSKSTLPGYNDEKNMVPVLQKGRHRLILVYDDIFLISYKAEQTINVQEKVETRKLEWYVTYRHKLETGLEIMKIEKIKDIKEKSPTTDDHFIKRVMIPTNKKNNKLQAIMRFDKKQFQLNINFLWKKHFLRFFNIQSQELQVDDTGKAFFREEFSIQFQDLSGNTYEETFRLKNSKSHSIKVPSRRDIQTFTSTSAWNFHKKSWGVIRSISLNCGLKNQPRFSDYSLFFSPLKFEINGKINTQAKKNYILSKQGLDSVICEGIRAKIRKPLRLIRGIANMYEMQKSEDFPNVEYRGYGQVTCFKFVAIYDGAGKFVTPLLLILAEEKLYFSLGRINFSVVGSISPHEKSNHYPSCFKILEANCKPIAGLEIKLLCSQPAKQLSLLVSSSKLENLKSFTQMNQKSTLDKHVNLKATQITKSIPNFVYEILMHKQHPFLLTKNLFFVLKQSKGFRGKIKSQWDSEQKTIFSIYRISEQPSEIKYIFIYSSLLAKEEDVKLAKFQNVQWICFRVIPQSSTFSTFRNGLLLAGIYNESKVVVKYIEIEIPKIGGQGSSKLSQKIWKLKASISDTLSIKNVNFGRIELDSNKSQDDYLLFIANGEVVLEYEIHLKITGQGTSEKKYNLILKRSYRYLAVGICSLGGNISLYYKSNYLFFVCNLDKFSGKETSISVFDRSDFFIRQKEKKKNGFTERNPSDTIQNQISQDAESLNLKFDFQFQENSIFYFTSAQNMINMYKIDGNNSIEFEDVSESQKRTVVNFKLEVNNLFQKKTFELDFVRRIYIVDIVKIYDFFKKNKPFFWVIVIYIAILSWLFLTKQILVKELNEEAESRKSMELHKIPNRLVDSITNSSRSNSVARRHDEMYSLSILGKRDQRSRNSIIKQRTYSILA